jgi:hypothetical protein
VDVEPEGGYRISSTPRNHDPRRELVAIKGPVHQDFNKFLMTQGNFFSTWEILNVLKEQIFSGSKEKQIRSKLSRNLLTYFLSMNNRSADKYVKCTNNF